MRLQRSSGNFNPYFEYLCRIALAEQQVSDAVRDLLRLPELRIPTFQRGISWSEEDVERFLDSDSIMLGHVIVANIAEDSFLIDGLQRLSIGTALLNILYPKVLSPTPSNPAAAAFFTKLKNNVSNLQPVFTHNHQTLLSHPRKAVMDAYKALVQELERLVETELHQIRVKAFAEKLTNTMTVKPIAIDVYSGFSLADLANTFIGLNTVRVELGPVDLIRSIILDQSNRSSPPWSTTTAEAIENHVTETFVENGKTISALVPVATAVLKSLQEKTGLKPIHVFSGWDNLSESEVSEFLDFIEGFMSASNPYLDEVRDSGSLPYAILMMFYYKQRRSTGTLPSFFDGGSSENPDLHRFLRATYRLVIEGTIGRSADILEQTLQMNFTSVTSVADAICAKTRSGSLSSEPDMDWLTFNLSVLDLRRSKRIFNACLLPARASSGLPFAPYIYGKKASHWNVDHLIPKSKSQQNVVGADEIETLRNFAPLESGTNRIANATPCSRKLEAGGIYPTLAARFSHPYLTWLSSNAPSAQDCDAQGALASQGGTSVGDKRIEAIAQILGKVL